LYLSSQVENRMFLQRLGTQRLRREIIMNELVQLVQQKTGLSQEMAQKVVDTIAGYLKTKLPEPMASGLDSLLGGSAGTAAAAGDAAAGAAADGEGVMDKAKAMVAGLSEMMGKKDA
jgi:hypothetical protein